MKCRVGIKTNSKRYGKGIPIGLVYQEFLGVIDSKAVDEAVEILAIVLV